MILLILAIVISIAIILMLAMISKSKKIDLYVSFVVGGVDEVCKSFMVGKNINVAGILGSDFFEKYGYIIDFKRNRIWHNLMCISFNEAMELLGIPFIVLWQDDRKYIFIIDTGSSNSHISSEALETMDFEFDTSKKFVTSGVGGSKSTSGAAIAKLTYK